MINCLLTGVGGQGTVLASKLLAQCAMNKGLFVRTAETIGMAQRGGSVVSHVRIGERSFSSLIPFGEADMIIGFEPAEAVRSLPYLKSGGTVVVSTRAVKPTTDALLSSGYEGKVMLDYLSSLDANIVFVDSDTICRRCGSAKVLNVVLLGAAIKTGVLGITEDEMLTAISERVKPRFIELNQKAFAMGME